MATGNPARIGTDHPTVAVDQPAVGLDHPTVVPANVDGDGGECPTCGHAADEE